MKSLTLLAVFIAVFLNSDVLAQQTRYGDPIISESKAVYLGQTEALRDLDLHLDHRSAKAEHKRGRRTPESFRYAQQYDLTRIPEKEHQGSDPIRHTEIQERSVVVPEINIDGVIYENGSPHDTSGDIGLDYYVQGVNGTTVGIFDKTDGALVESFDMQVLWDGFGFSSTGDPIILFDDVEQRWFISEIVNFSSIALAVSTSSDPLGSYNIFNFSAPSLPDYPKYGLWPEALVITVNEPGPDILEQYFIDKSALINGNADATLQRIVFPGVINDDIVFLVTSPIDVDGINAPSSIDPITIVLDDSSWGLAEEDQLAMFRFSIDWADENNTTVEEIDIPLSPFDSNPCSVDGGLFACMPQLDGVDISGFQHVIMNVPKMRVYDDYESIVFAFITDVTDGDNVSGIRWTELRKDTGDAPWEVYQEGSFAPDDGLQRFVPAISQDAYGNIALAYSVTSADSYVGLRYTGRLATDPLGEMTFPEIVIVDGENGIDDGGRYGDYAQMGVDPQDGITFWFTSEYATGGTSSHSRIVSFKNQIFGFDLSAVEITEPNTSDDLTASEAVTVTYSNPGLTPMEDYTVGLLLDGNLVEEVLIEGVLAPGEEYTHTYNNTVDLSTIGTYVFEAYISHPDDEGFFNDQTFKTLEHLLTRDAGLLNIETLESTCLTNLEVTASIENAGFETLQEASINILVNDVLVDTFLWTGELDYLESESFEVDVPLAQNGTNTIELLITEINGAEDQNTVNDGATAQVELIEAPAFVFELLLDNYPSETTWDVIDNETSEMVANGGNYPGQNGDLITRILCLDPGKCYTLTIYDSFGDGICCGFGEGFYTFSFGEELMFEGGEFESFASHGFCGDGTILSVDEQALPEEAFDLIISPNPTNDLVRIQLESEAFVSPMINMEVFDPTGRQIQYQKVSKYGDQYQVTISLLDYPSGNYVLRLSDGSSFVSQTIVKL